MVCRTIQMCVYKQSDQCPKALDSDMNTFEQNPTGRVTAQWVTTSEQEVGYESRLW